MPDFLRRGLKLARRGQKKEMPVETEKPSLMALEPRYMYDAAGLAALDEFKNLICENGASKIEELQASADASQTERSAAGSFDGEASLAFKEPAGGGLREEFSLNYNAATLQDIPTGPEGSSVYALSGAFSLPFLQGDPVGYLWSAPTRDGGLASLDTQEYFKALNGELFAGSVPQTEAERLAEAVMWQEDAAAEMAEREESLENEKTNLDDIADIASELMPYAQGQGDAMAKALENIDLKATDENLETADPAAFERDLNRLEYDVRSMTKDVLLDKALEAADAELDAMDVSVQAALDGTEAAETEMILDKAENVYLYDSDDFLLYSDFDELVWKQWVSDILDMGTVLDVESDALTTWMEENADIPEFSPPLDNGGDSAQIQDKFSEFGDGVSDLLQRLEMKIQDNAKDRK